MYLKMHPGPSGEVAALCDAELLGRVLSSGSIRLDLKKHAGFYEGRKVTHKEAVSALASSANANLVGKKSLEAAKEAGLDVSSAILILGVPHLQVYRL
ncbi:TPA: DUF424 domain-containing protein [Candidatus Micrarchaeota archaeon]|nr:DUF424 domain-containing protein [Candidatus Micrarchaeota archaeon]HIH30672.1 DUF424 domain-containing protein [Candidatus Micrarchaeota archaeon]